MLRLLSVFILRVGCDRREGEFFAGPSPLLCMCADFCVEEDDMWACDKTPWGVAVDDPGEEEGGKTGCFSFELFLEFVLA